MDVKTFEKLVPDAILNAVEKALGNKLTALIAPLPSYINRVYELRGIDGTKMVAKFYRPGRWDKDALLDEHRFILDCAEIEIPVVSPLLLQNGETLDRFDDIYFALFPKRSGRQLEITEDRDWVRIGSLIARMHLAGEKRTAVSRVRIDPQFSATTDVLHLFSEVIPGAYRQAYRDTAMRIIDSSFPLFEKLEVIRIHGDCHMGNILDRLEEGLVLIDFDDMAMGPPVQDLWLLLPDRPQQCTREIDLFLTGYEQFRHLNRLSLRCIESLRAMRMIYFLSWCSRQRNDFQFRRNFPDWGSDAFWSKEIHDLREQMGFVLDQSTDSWSDETY